MSVKSYIPTLWAGKLLTKLPTLTVSEVGVNHDYEGDVIGAGSVKANKTGDVLLKSYTGQDITNDDMSTSDITIDITHKIYFSSRIDDVDKAQVKNSGELMDKHMYSAAQKIAVDKDYANFTAMITEGTKLEGIPKVTTSAEAKAVLLRLKTEADKSNVPSFGRVLFAGPEFENTLLSDTTINLAAPTANDSLKVGYIGKLYGIEIYSANTVKNVLNIDDYEEGNTEKELKTDGKEYIILTHSLATTEAIQLSEIEALRSEKSFKDIVRGLFVSGRKVLYPEAVIVTEVDYSTE